MKPAFQDPVLRVALLAGLGGFVVGCGYGTWQVAVESAQVVAGIVQYPHDNPFYMYHTKIWTLAHQIGAVLLTAGMSDRTLSLLVSGIVGMVSFQALALVVFALCRDPWLAVGFPFLAELARVPAFPFGISYPIWLLGTSHTYGVLGLSSALLVVALLGNGRYRAGALALGLLPAVHPSLGVWTALVVGVAVAWDLRALRAQIRAALPWLIAGAALAAVSLGVHMLATYDVPHGDPAAMDRYLHAFIRLWDSHRRPVSLGRPGVWIGAGTLVLSLLWIFLFRSGTPDGPPAASRLLLRILAVCAVLGIILIAVGWAPLESLPDKLLILMPNRLLNLNVLAGAALLIGLLASYRDVAPRAVLASLLVLGAVVPHVVGIGYLAPNPSLHPAFHGIRWPPYWPLIALGTAAGFLIVWAAMHQRAAPAGPAARPDGTRHKWSAFRRAHKRDGAKAFPGLTWAGALRWAAVAALGWATCVTLTRAYTHWHERDWVLRGYDNDALLAKVAGDPGMLLTAADLHLIQLRTRRPVLMDGGALDVLVYTLEAGPSLDRVLRDAYGIDLFDPPPDVVEGVVPPLSGRFIWEERSEEEWKKIAAEFGVTGVLTYPDWILRLPRVALSDELAYYTLTEEKP